MIAIDETDDSLSLPVAFALDSLPGEPFPVAKLMPPSAPPTGASLAEIVADLEAATAAIPAGADGAFIGQWTRGEWLGAVIVKTPGDNPLLSNWQVKAWIRKEEGHRFDYGVGVLKTFKF